MTDPSLVGVIGSLQPFAAGFATELARQGYTPRSLQTQLHLMAHVSRWLHARDLDVGDLPRWTQQFLQARLDAGYQRHLTGKALRPLLAYLREEGATLLSPTPLPTGPVEETLARYRRYLTVERGLGEATARGYVDAVRPFLHRCVSVDGVTLDLQGLGEADVTAFMVARCAEQSCRPAQLTATALRSLLNFLHVTGAIARSLMGAALLRRRPKGLLPAARQELLDPSKAWWGGRRGRLADRPRYSISVSLGVVPRWYSRVVEVPVRIEVAAGFVAPGASEPPRLQPSWPPGGSRPAHG